MGLLTRADPYAIRGPGGEPTVRALLDAGAAQVQTELMGEPDLQADMLTAMGRTYRRLGLYDKAQELLEQALASGRTAFGREHVRVAQTLDYLGVVLAASSRLGESSDGARQIIPFSPPAGNLSMIVVQRAAVSPLGPRGSRCACRPVELWRSRERERPAREPGYA